jgi:ABC-type antimicrobial peptide transport system permease subunit
LFLAAIGVYGMIAYSTGQRVREMGIRIALGAQRSEIVRLVLKEGLVPTITGIALGIMISGILARAMSGLLFGVAETDPLTLITASTALLAVATLACFPAAWRASSVDPMQALRMD